MPRPKNEFYELAASLAEEYGNKNSVMMFMRDLKDIRVAGLDRDEVIIAWRQLRSPEGINGFSVPQATLKTVWSKGSPSYLEQWLTSFMESMPPIYDSAAYDEWVRKNASILRKNGFKYTWANEQNAFDGSRMTYDEALSLGLVD